ncbi:thiopeptide-type bacteriocin biosynthesis domain-containing protein [Algoriphagus locisalis]|uniref:Thiopeptide-type bacteriocin biosynthesis domain-containing protein n=1 Tax=Algoriphagus locisalis TaxID=305507 RepID=A0A1I6Y6Y8_9BACT|nr:thiopeptide-type bacteriocin biosynthesis protein [Algoriphagus locisalis]SFT46325.1 thiopeptide-type bacteriocin biosynthesis domain-containing protein [Algoriphagus locisalis]
MDFLYRMHLVDFDPMDKDEIQKNWHWIKQAIQLSSRSLFQELEKQEFDSLSQSTQAKIHKYLLRGRYRATPFGLWAGVGLGRWGDCNQVDLPLVYSQIEKEEYLKYKQLPKLTTKYRLAPGLKVYSSQVQFWSYCSKEEGWRISYLDKNPLILILISYFKKSDNLGFSNFQNFFNTSNRQELRTLWEMLLESGLLIREGFPAVESTPANIGWDVRIKSKITLSHGIHEKLETLISELGNLFVPVESEYLRNFKSWFVQAYDDRFVPLSLLAHQQDFFTHGAVTESEEHLYNKDLQAILWDEKEELDLSNCFAKKHTDLHHLQIAFKLIGGRDIYIENIVCNRPFAYSGRFSLDPEIKNWAEDNLEAISASSMKADIILFETSKSNHICRHDNAFQYSIYPFGAGIKNDHLGVDDLLLGIRNKRLVLYSQKLDKEILPVVQHPLNPDQISHTLSRLIWEIGNQDQHRFLPYHHPSFQKASYTPRLTWQGIILQGRKWIINSNDFSGKNALLVYLNESEIPCPLIAGHLDRELLLNWRRALELDFLWEELTRMHEVTIFECPWKDNSPFKTKTDQHLYPQFIYSRKGKASDHPKIDFLNRISSPDERWIYLRIAVKEAGILPLLLKPLPSILKHMKNQSNLQKWYFLIYSSARPEIRLRVLTDEKTEKRKLESELARALMESGWVEKVNSSLYYPEYDKYALLDGDMKVSESIFHLESEVVLLGNYEYQTKPIITWDVETRQTWIIETYFNVIQMCRKTEEFLAFYKGLIKGIPIRERKELNKSVNPSTQSYNSIPIEFFESEFSKIADSSEEILMRIIPNHLHMCCNRSFPFDTAMHERQVIYGLYKRLGRSIYGRLNSL